MATEFTLALRVVDLVGVVLNGLIGGSIARHKHFDAVGFVVLAIVSALGGGIMRDVLLASGRPVAIDDPSYLIGALTGAGIAFFLRFSGRVWRVFFGLADAVCLGAWAATGTAKSLAHGVHWLPAMILGVATAVGGGMIRDVTAGSVPQVFGGSTLYATPAMLSAGVYAAATVGFGLPGAASLGAATVAGATLAAISQAYGWRLPVHGDGTYAAARARLARARRRAARKRRASGE